MEVFASSVAVPQAAQMLRKTVTAVRQLWREVNDVPATIEDTLGELEMAAKFMESVEAEFNTPGSASSPEHDTVPSIQRLAIERCRKVHDEMKGLVADLSCNITSLRSSKKMIARAKVVLKKEDLENYDRRLRKALRFLDSAIQLCIAETATNNHCGRGGPILASQKPHASTKSDSEPAAEQGERQTHYSRYVAGTEGILPRPPSERGALRDRSTRFSTSVLRAIGLSWRVVEKQNIPALPPTKSYYVQFTPPTWLLSKAWELQLSLASSGWTFGIRSYVVIPEESKVFRVLENGTLDQLFKLFRDGVASPFSKDRFGNTLLHHCMSYRMEFVEPLMRACYSSADLLVKNDFGYTPFDTYAQSIVGQNCDVTVHRFLLSLGVYDDLCANVDLHHFDDDTEVSWARASAIMLRGAQHFESIRSAFFPKFYEWPKNKRAIPTLSHLEWKSVDPRVIPRFFHNSDTWRIEDIHQELDGQSPFEKVADEWAMFAWNSIRRNSDEDSRKEARRGWWRVRYLFWTMAAIMDVSELTYGPKDAEFWAKSYSLLLETLWTSVHAIASLCDEHCPNPNCPSRIVTDVSDGFFADEPPPTSTTTARENWLQDLRQLLHVWVGDIKHAGHDLVAYGQAEAAAFELIDPFPTYPRQELSECYQQDGEWCRRKLFYEIKGIKYGPEPEDWDFILDFVGEEDEEVIELLKDLFTGHITANLLDQALGDLGSDEPDDEYKHAEEEEEQFWDAEDGQENLGKVPDEGVMRLLMPGAWVDDPVEEDPVEAVMKDNNAAAKFFIRTQPWLQQVLKGYCQMNGLPFNEWWKEEQEVGPQDEDRKQKERQVQIEDDVD